VPPGAITHPYPTAYRPNTVDELRRITHVLKNSLYARFDPRSGTKHAVFGAF
jgi:hypothetical protein